ncbi:MAG: DUF3857 domain-containing protein [Dysgonamonadaceae bacterium]|jgi:hypothetical protein|nr:DUF3857 domain-containing protein [Dysgonamonadaceae bacterium]
MKNGKCIKAKCPSTNNRTKYSKRLIYSLLLFFAAGVSGNMAADDYADYAREIRNEIWAWDKPEFKNYALPDEYQKESAVILAHHQEIKALSKNKLRVNLSLNFSMNRELYYTNIDRQTVKINDQVALEKYSEIAFKEEAKTQGAMRSNEYRLVVGIRIIKPDGSIKEVDVDDEAVAVTEGKKDKKAYQKLAVPGLQVGDVLDYFFCNRLELETQNVGIQYFPFYDQYPVLTYSVHCEISRKLTVEYASMNGAPDFVRSTNEDKDIVLDVARKNLPKIESARWTSFFRDLPALRINILNNASKNIYKPQSARKDGIYKRGDNLEKQHLLDDAINFVRQADQPVKLKLRTQILMKVKKLTKNYQKQHPDISQEALADYIYDAINFHIRSLSSSYPVYFPVLYKELLKDFKIPGESILAVNKYGPRMSDMITDDDLAYGFGVNSQRYYFYPYSLYQTSFDIPYAYQGEEAYIYAATTLKGSKLKYIDVTDHDIRLPQTRSEDNKSASVMKVTFAPDDPSTLNIDRRTEYSGQLKLDVQRLLGSYEEWDKEMRKRLQIEKTMEEEMQDDRHDRKYVDDMKAVFEKRRNDQKDSVKVEIEHFHDLPPKEISTYELSALGITPDRPNAQYSVAYSLDGLVKKAGKNLILDAGKLIGSQWTPDANDRLRTMNAYIPTARMLIWEIEIQIPENYQVQGMEKLNKSEENACASFRSTASLEGNILKISAEKNYRTSFVPFTEWNKLIEVMDKTNEFYSQSVVLTPIQR